MEIGIEIELIVQVQNCSDRIMNKKEKERKTDE